MFIFIREIEIYMKKSILLLFISFLFVCIGNAQWELQNPLPVADDLNDVQFYNDQLDYGCSEREEVFNYFSLITGLL
jgi:hypothetical protein